MRLRVVVVCLLVGCAGGGMIQDAGVDAGTSASCGSTGQPCCNGSACNAGFVCESAVCIPQCGGLHQACCQEASCTAGLTCIDSQCEIPGGDAGMMQSSDAGTSADAGAPADAGTSADAGSPPDGGMSPDAGSSDAGTSVDAGNDGGTVSGADAGASDGGVREGGCSSDSDCSSGERCCANDHTCNPVVAENADCDCDHPCPTDEACEPGTCGATPQQCRPSCDPGNQTTPAQTCANTPSGDPAYCAPVPTGQSTPQGGACTPGDSCDVVKQDCPDMPLDRSKPAGSDNPTVPYTCVPAAPGSPGVNECMPAGMTQAGGSNCAFECGNDTTNCIKGYVCVTPLNSNGQACGASTCQAQCSDPWAPDPSSPFSTPPQAPDCPQGQYCAQLLGNGSVTYATGSCTSITPNPMCF